MKQGQILGELDDFVVSDPESNERLDKMLGRHYSEQSRSYFQELIEAGHVLVNGKRLKKRYLVQAGDTIQVRFVLNQEISLTPEPIPLEIIFEDQALIAINKPVGMVVHPAPGHWTGTLVNGLLHHCQTFHPDDQTLRPGIVHRLDKGTSGVIVAAKNRQAHQALVETFANREAKKRYLAICIGNPAKGVIDAPIGRHPVHRKKMCVDSEKGKAAVTTVNPLVHDERYSLIEAYPKTGRTHQIRVHLKQLNCPILGDDLYGNPQVNQNLKIEHPLLHAEQLEIPHPITKEPLVFNTPPPSDFLAFATRFPYDVTARYQKES